MMTVGALALHLRMDGCQSLKDKRRLLRACMDKASHSFRVSIAEVSDMDLWNVATVGVAAVSNSPSHTEAVLRQVIEIFDRSAEIVVESADLRLDQVEA
jgi:uncharacterized protein